MLGGIDAASLGGANDMARGGKASINTARRGDKESAICDCAGGERPTAMPMSSSTAAAVGAAAAATAAAAYYYLSRNATPDVRVTYWGGRGLCEPLRCILAAAGVEFTDVFLTAETGREELAKLRSAGKLSLTSFHWWRSTASILCRRGDRELSQRSLRAAAQIAKAGIPRRVRAGSSQDARSPMVGLPFAQYPKAEPTQADFEKRLSDMRGGTGLLGRHAPKWEAMLSDAGPFILGARPSIADVGIFECVDLFQSLFGTDEFDASFAPFPRVRALVAATRSLGRLAEHCESGRKTHATWDAATGKHSNLLKYASAVRSTLA